MNRGQPIEGHIAAVYHIETARFKRQQVGPLRSVEKVESKICMNRFYARFNHPSCLPPILIWCSKDGFAADPKPTRLALFFLREKGERCS